MGIDRHREGAYDLQLISSADACCAVDGLDVPLANPMDPFHPAKYC